MNVKWGARAVAALLVVLTVTGAFMGYPARVQAAPPAQGALSFDDANPTTGTLDNTTPQVSYTFQCLQGMVGSVQVKTSSGDLETAITVYAADGQPLASGSGVSSDPNVSVAEAFIIPADGQCRVDLSRQGSTSGRYEARLLPGYANLDRWDTFDGSNGPLGLNWGKPYASSTLETAVVNQQLQIKVKTENLLGYATPDVNATWSDFYMQADFTIEDSPTYYEYGFVFRANTDADTFYSLAFSTDGDWSLYYHDPNAAQEWTAIQEWTVVPVIDGSDLHPHVAVWAHGNTFRAYFNGQLVGDATDANNSASEGLIGLGAATKKGQLETLVVDADNLVVTTPYQGKTSLPFGGQGGTPLPPTPAAGLLGILGATRPPEASPTPTQPLLPLPTATPQPQPSGNPPLTSWNSSRPSDVVGELQRQGVAPAGGSAVLNVPSSYGDTSSASWSYFPLGQGKTYGNFVLSFDARLVMTGAGSGCGIDFWVNNGSTTVLVTEDGSAFLGQFDSNGDPDPNNWFEASNAVKKGEGASNRVTLVAIDGKVTLYVNGQFLTSVGFKPQTGSVALSMYVNKDDSGATQETYCQLNNIWLWEFPG
jgi:hypothetical protein